MKYALKTTPEKTTEPPLEETAERAKEVEREVEKANEPKLEKIADLDASKVTGLSEEKGAEETAL